MTADERAATEALLSEFFAAPAGPPSPDERGHIEEIRDVRRLPDGRVLVVSVGSSALAEGVAFAILPEVGGRWLIDEAGAVGPDIRLTPFPA